MSEKNTVVKIIDEPMKTGAPVMAFCPTEESLHLHIRRPGDKLDYSWTCQFDTEINWDEMSNHQIPSDETLVEEGVWRTYEDTPQPTEEGGTMNDHQSNELTPSHLERVAYAIFREHNKSGVSFEGVARDVSLKAARAAIKQINQPVLEDGIYEVTDRVYDVTNEDRPSRILHVRNGRYSSNLNPNGTLYASLPLPDDTSDWRRLRVLGDDEVAVGRDFVVVAAAAASECGHHITALNLQAALDESR